MKMPDLTRRRLLILLAIMSLGLIVWTKRLDLVFFLSRGMDTTYRVKLPFCDCYRDTKLSRSDRNVFRTSSCPMSALRGSGQRILSYSFFDDPHTSDTLNRNFFKGIKENLDGIREQYNSHTFDLRGQKKGSLFSMRVYFQLHSTSKNKKELCDLTCSEPQLDICEIPRSNKLFPMLWRYFPIGDKETDVLLPRDLDSRITPRELLAVHDFLSTNKSIHIMRDHMHHGTEILGGMWGVKLKDQSSRKTINDALSRILRDPIAFKPRTEAEHDQTLLTKYIWPLVPRLGLTHDSYHCRKYPGGSAFPSNRPFGPLNFVGAVADINNTLEFSAKNECPFKCRPKEHKDWAFC
eukprot:TRINITY_DN3231_c0_g2_i2.p1 TRINITY_DN3231_c0_g2~~TRINITY_DN3231_c0_g2_i2.p1  ORF type:complete len:350 (-),score=10.10 TRINITY_DN3231_c0_g2_i2:110-1159(-)